MPVSSGVLCGLALTAMSALASFALPTLAGADPMSRVSRVKYASELAENFARVKEALPTLSPSQKAWLVSEEKAARDAGSHARYLSLWNSKEYDLDLVHSHLDGLLRALEVVRDREVAEQREVYSWLVVSQWLMEGNFWGSLHSLSDKSLFDLGLLEFIKAHPPDDLELLRYSATGMASRILERIVKPHIAGTLP